MVSAFAPLMTLDKWFAQDGEQKAGLPSGSLYNVRYNVISFKNTAGSLHDSMENFVRVWGRSQSDNMFVASLPNLLLLLKSMQYDANVAESFATMLKTEASQAYGLIDRHKTANARERENLRRSIAGIDRQIENNKKAIKEARDELQGDKAFLNGFLTGLTLGIHNPVKANLDKQRTAIASNRALRANNVLMRDALRKKRDELTSLTRCVERIGEVAGQTTHFQNLVLQALPDMEQAYKKLERAENHTKLSIVARYRDRARSRLDEVGEWEQAFRPFS